MGLEAKLNSDGFFVTQLETIISWSRKNSVYPMPMGISCCSRVTLKSIAVVRLEVGVACDVMVGFVRTNPVNRARGTRELRTPVGDEAVPVSADPWDTTS